MRIRLPGALGPWLLSLVALVYVVHEQLDAVRLRLLVLAAALLAGAGLWHQRAMLRRGPVRRAVLAAAAASALLAALWVALVPVGRDAYAVAQTLVPVLLGWGMILGLRLRADAARTVEESAADRTHGGAVAAIAAGAAVVLTACTHLNAHWLGIDEVVYLLQSDSFTRLEYLRHWDESLQRFFALSLTIARPDGFYTQYPPGYPALLAVFSALGARALSGPLLAAATVALAYLIGRRVHSGRAGLIAAALVATHDWFLYYGASYMSHTATMAALAGGGWLLLRAEGARGRARTAQWWLAGFLLGAAVTMRPVAGVAVGLSLWLWVGLRRRLSRAEFAVMTGVAALGAIPSCAGLLYYNDVTNGSPWRFGYQQLQGDLHRFGFGLRGTLFYDDQARLVASTERFTPFVALRNLVIVAWRLALRVLPVFTLLPVLAVGRVYRAPFRWAAVAAFLPLPLIYFFYFGNEYRHYLELFPFLFVGLGVLLAHIRERDARLGRSLLVVLLAANVLVGVVRLGKQYRDYWYGYSGFPFVERVRAAERRYGRVLVFARGQGLFVALYRFNVDGFPGNVIVARDLGAENARLIARFPHHVPLLATGQGISPLTP